MTTEAGAAPAAAATTTSTASTGISAATIADADAASVTVPTQAVSSPADWTTGLNDDNKGWLQNKAYKDPSILIDSFRGLEKLIGAPKEKILKLPENMEDQAAMAEIYGRLGRPATADGYKIDVPKEGGDPEFANWAKNTFHKAGLTAKQAEAVVANWAEYTEGFNKASSEKNIQENQVQEQALKKKWGAAFDQNVNVAKLAAREFGIAADVIDKMENAMGFSQVMELLHKVGSKMGESSFVTGGSAPSFNGMLTPEAAQQQINAKRQDHEFTKRYLAGDGAARAEMEKLHRMAHPDL